MSPEHRALVALERLTADGWPATVREVAAAAGWRSPSTAHRVLRRLVASGRAEFREGRGFRVAA